MSEDGEVRLSFKDYIAFVIALLTTNLLPLVVMIVIIILLVALLGYMLS